MRVNHVATYMHVCKKNISGKIRTAKSTVNRQNRSIQLGSSTLTPEKNRNRCFHSETHQTLSVHIIITGYFGFSFD